MNLLPSPALNVAAHDCDADNAHYQGLWLNGRALTQAKKDDMKSMAILHGARLELPSEPATLSETLLATGRDFPSRGISFVDSSGREDFISYPQLIEQARLYLSTLRSIGIEAGDKVIIEVDDPKQFYFTFWACVFGGIVPAPIAQPVSFDGDGNGIEKLRNVWEALDWPIVIIDEKNRANYESLRSYSRFIHLYFRSTTDLASSNLAAIHPASPNDLVFLQYSSGSTGQPHGVALTHLNVLANNIAIFSSSGLSSDDTVCTWLPHTHDMGLVGQHIYPIYQGCKIVKFTPATFIRSPALFMRKVTEHRASWFCCPNFGLDWMTQKISDAELAKLDLSCLRLIFNGAEPISVAVMEAFSERFARAGFRPTAMFPVYGMAEATLAVAFPRVGTLPTVKRIARNELVNSQVAVGASDAQEWIDVVGEGGPVAGIGIRIADGDDNVVMEDIIGEIQLKGPSMCAAYFDNPEANASCFIDGWFKTGDLGFVSEGVLFVTGRIKDILFVRGQNYYAHDIEEVIYGYGEIARGALAVVGTFDHATQSEQLLAFVKHKGDLTLFVALRARLVTHVSATLGLSFAHVLPVNSIPKTTSGKTQRFVLRARFENGEFATAIAKMASLILEQKVDSIPLSEPENELEMGIRTIWSKVLALPQEKIGVDCTFLELGGNSIKALQLLGELEQLTGTEMGHEILIHCKTIRDISRFVVTNSAAQYVATSARHDGRPDDALDPTSRDIAITGLAIRFPFAETLEQFWDNLCNKKDCISQVSSQRRGLAGNPKWDDWMGELRDIEMFDNEFFSIDPESARFMDPQQRILLELAYQCLEDAGMSARLDQDNKIGVYAGISSNSYAELVVKLLHRKGIEAIHQSAMVGNMPNIIAAQISHAFNFTGPSMVIDTACSSFLVCLNEAVDSLRSGKVSGALVASSHLMVTPTTHMLSRRTGILSKSNRCKVFDKEADGSTLGEGAVVIYVETLDDALRNGKHIYGILKGIATNNDGYSLGIMAPNPRSQLVVLQDAYRDAHISPAQVSYIEAHGTGTIIGDPIELRALGNLFRQFNADNPCGIGSVKSNIGHLLHAAGGAGLTKVLLSLINGCKVPSLFLETLNPSLEMEKSSFHVVSEIEPWFVEPGTVRTAGLSSFGFGGTNAHAVLQEYVAPRNWGPDAETAAGNTGYVLTLSAKSPTSLQRLMETTRAWASQHKELSPADLCLTRNVYRKHFAHRAAIVFDTLADLAGIGDTGLIGCFDQERPARTLYVIGSANALPSVDVAFYRDNLVFRTSLQQALIAIDNTWASQLDDCLLKGAALPHAHANTLSFAIKRASLLALKSMGARIATVMEIESGQIIDLDVQLPDPARERLFSVSDIVPMLEQHRPEVIVLVGATDSERIDLQRAFSKQKKMLIIEPAHHGSTICRRALLSLIARLYVQGSSIDWTKANPAMQAKMVRLPGYAFDRSPFWIELE